ncbi:hypothetical protein HDU85_007452 [Gaertneriomyces sp. JEL0708]|nr:hypothetical protein HDU85_007452 [Gaertneriomyces sp. JEL0708]
MPDLTATFSDLIKAHARHRHLRADGTGHELAETSILRPLKLKRNDLQDVFLKEAYRLLEHVRQLGYFLVRVRPYYLDIYRHVKPRTDHEDNTLHLQLDKIEGLPLLKMLPRLTKMNDQQRHELDVQIQSVMKALVARISLLERSADKIPVNPSKATGSFLSSLLGDAAEDSRRRLMQEHRRSVIWLIQKRLMDASNVQKDMQEHVMRRNLQRDERLSRRPVPTHISSRAGTSPLPATSDDSAHNLSIAKLASTLTSTFAGHSSAVPISPRSSEVHPAMDEDPISRASHDDDVALQLTANERMLLESENAALLESLESSIDQVIATTQSLAAISDLQAQLSHHLQTQAETIDSLYEESWRSTETVQAANIQLKKAQKNFGDARLWVLIFLVMASAILWFLEYYG